MDIIANQKFIHTSPRKLRLVADMVRGLEPAKALDVLKITPKAAANDLFSAIKVALANAKQKGLEAEKIIFKKIEINESTKMKRYRAGSRGRVKPYKRRMSHIKIVLTDDLSEKGKVQSEKLKKAKKEEK